MSSNDRQAIEQMAQTYLDGLYEGDADKLASVFHDTSVLTYEQDDARGLPAFDQAGSACSRTPSARATFRTVAKLGLPCSLSAR